MDDVQVGFLVDDGKRGHFFISEDEYEKLIFRTMPPPTSRKKEQKWRGVKKSEEEGFRYLD
jgi:hypothetical protein